MIFLCLGILKLMYLVFTNIHTMKKLVLSIFMISALAVNAQENIIKLNLLGLALGNIGVQYERTLGEHSSLAMGISYLPSRSLPDFVIDEDSTTSLKSMSFSGWTFTPEYRYYFSGKAPKGFYVAPYFRYSTFIVDKVDISYTSTTTNQEVKVPADGSYKATTVGLMLGSQWLLGEHMTLDWWILGVGFGSQEAEITALGDFSQIDIQDIKNELADIDEEIPGSMDYTVTSNSVNIKYDPEMPGFRGFGLCLGYKF
jgi:hypothetical protein